MDSSDDERYPIPIYFTDEQSKIPKRSLPNQRAGRCGRGRGSHNRGSRGQKTYKSADTLDKVMAFQSSKDGRSNGNIRTQRPCVDSVQVEALLDPESETRHVSHFSTMGHRIGSSRRGRYGSKEDIWRGENSGRDRNESDGHETHAARGRGYRGRGRGRGKNDDKTYARHKIDENDEDRAKGNFWGCRPKSAHRGFNQYENVDEGNFRGTERSRGRGKRGGRFRLKASRSETSLNLLRSDEYQTSAAQDKITVARRQRGKENSLSGTKIENSDGNSLAGNEKVPREITVGYKKLEEWSNMIDDPDDLVLTIGNSRSGLVECLGKQLKPDWLHRILEILSVAVKTQTCTGFLRDLLANIEVNLLQKLNDLLSQILIESETHRQFFTEKEHLCKICILIITVLKYHMNVLPASLGKCVPIILLLKQVQHEHNLDEKSLINEIQELELMKDSIKEEREKLHRLQRMTRSAKGTKDINVESEPPESFRQLTVLPAAQDLELTNEPFLRPNIEDGQYKDLEQYLDIHFRLLREDYIRPLREGIRDYKSGLSSGLSVQKTRDIRLYHDVQVVMPVCTLSGICYVLQFDTEPFKRINWSATKRLLYGSLVCLSSNDFDTFVFGTVTDRDPKHLTNGKIQILFENKDDMDIKPNVTYTMAETTAYFEAYRHVLEGLHEMEESMPLQRYIVNCETEIYAPDYLLSHTIPVYDFTCLLSQSAIRRGLREFPILDTNKWPRERHLSFDTSQLEALKMALTKELVLIQGPPGTGKTYVGLKIAEMLLANKAFWMSENRKTCQILVVCYTNHALDQFLEGIHAFCKDGIVRVGGRSNNETLEPFLLKNIRRRRRMEKSRSIGLFKGEKDCLASMNVHKTFIERVSRKLQSCSGKLIPVEELESIASPMSYGSLQRRISYKFREKALAIWLEFTTEKQEEEQAALERQRPVIKLNKIWKQMILSDISPMVSKEACQVKNIYKLGLYERAQLYLIWVATGIKCMTDALENVIEEADILKTKLQATVEKSKRDIIPLETLESFNLPSQYKSQIVQLTGLDCRHPHDCQVKKWLFLDFSRRSCDLIKDLIQNPPTESTDVQDDDDLEEDRRLDDEDDDFLEDYNPRETEHAKLKYSLTESDWMTVLDDRKLEKKLRHLLGKPPAISDEAVTLIGDVWELPLERRKELYRYWVRKYRTVLKQKIIGYEKEYQNAVKKYKEVVDLENFDILRSATVIGMTTTGAAKNRALLQKVGPKILIVEEAAEVMESHIVTNLNRNCKHLILIGDHKQLRPNPTVYELARRYKLDISLFERMIINKIPCVTLSEQHRMRPEISVLLRHKNLYPNLRDHPAVTQYEDILGIDGNVCFIDHKEPEEQSGESTSYYNTHEAEFLAALCKYLLMQGYNEEQITVLSPYMGQVLTLRKVMPKHEFNDVRITAVDNFQGEENDIILLSLVRSGPEDGCFVKRNPIGFLGIENRVCVALSRAKKGLFVIGNFQHLAANSEMWEYMVHTMRAINKFKKSVTIRCQNHPESAYEASVPDDFKKSPDGGCKLSCKYLLPCGHICKRFCHILDKDHKLYRCFEPCAKKNPCGHKCQKKCHEECDPCLAITEKVIPTCGHTANMKCYCDPVKYVCKEICRADLPCGHKCNLKCGDCSLYRKHRELCEAKIEKQWPCGHIAPAKCFHNPETSPCPHPCNTRLNCGHTCSGTCGGCLGGKIHKSCSGICNKTLLCGHSCSFPCSEICPPCSKKCDWICSHGLRCNNKCSQECVSCFDNCTMKCLHKKCTKVCSEECENNQCDMPCKQLLDCGHPCAGLCGEICPKLCPVCEPNKFSNLKEKVIFLRDCKCVVSVQIMDLQMEQALKAVNPRTIPLLRCPTCNKPVATVIKRYINFMKERRKLIIQRYLMLTGTPEERKREASRLKKNLQYLKTLGLTPTAAKQFETNLKSNDFGSLHNTKRNMEIFEDLLKLMRDTTRSMSENRNYILEQASKIQNLLMTKRKFITSQFWSEAQNELRSLRSTLNRAGEVQVRPGGGYKSSLRYQRDASSKLTTPDFGGQQSLQDKFQNELKISIREEDRLSNGLSLTKADAREISVSSDEVVVASDEVID